MRDGPPMSPVLTVEDARVTRGRRKILRGVSFALRPSEIVVLLGPNGAGKSTLVKALSGRLRLEHGSVRIDGRDPFGDSKARLGLGVVPQGIALYEKLTALENLQVFGRLMGVRARNVGTTARETLERVGLTKRAHDRVDALSGGMRRRINIAAALMHNPKLLVLDEPTAGLDARSRIGLSLLLRDLRLGGLSILLVTHDMEEAEGLADRALVLVAGEIRAEGPPRDLIQAKFAGRRQITLSIDPAAAHRHRAIAAALTSSGLTPQADGRTWSGLVEGTEGGIERLMQTAAAAGAMIEDVRIRRPGLEALLARYVLEQKARR